MAESRTDHSGGFVVDKRVKEENHEAERNHHHHHHHHKETHGLRDDIDEETPITDVKAPNVFERAKEEIEAIVEAIHSKKETQIETHRDSFFQGSNNRDSAEKAELNPESSDSHSVAAESSKSPNLLERAKEDIEALIHKQKKSPHGHHKETHGTSNDIIDENTPVSEVKGPSVFQRAKEELEAILDTIHPKKDSRYPPPNASTKKEEEGGFKDSIGRGLEKICSPRNHSRD